MFSTKFDTEVTNMSKETINGLNNINKCDKLPKRNKRKMTNPLDNSIAMSDPINENVENQHNEDEDWDEIDANRMNQRHHGFFRGYLG